MCTCSPSPIAVSFLTNIMIYSRQCMRCMRHNTHFITSIHHYDTPHTTTTRSLPTMPLKGSDHNAKYSINRISSIPPHHYHHHYVRHHQPLQHQYHNNHQYNTTNHCNTSTTTTPSHRHQPLQHHHTITPPPTTTTPSHHHQPLQHHHTTTNHYNTITPPCILSQPSQISTIIDAMMFLRLTRRQFISM